MLKPALIGQKYHKKLHVHMCACACECGNMTKFIRQKGGAECEHSEDVCEVDQRHKLTLSTWSDKVNLSASPDDECGNEVLLGLRPHHCDEVSHCQYDNPFPDDWEVRRCRSHRARTWSFDHLNQLPMGSFVAQTQLTQTLQSLRNEAQLSTTKVVELAGRVLQSLCLANTQLESVASLLATKVALLFLCLFL